MRKCSRLAAHSGIFNNNYTPSPATTHEGDFAIRHITDCIGGKLESYPDNTKRILKKIELIPRESHLITTAHRCGLYTNHWEILTDIHIQSASDCAISRNYTLMDFGGGGVEEIPISLYLIAMGCVSALYKESYRESRPDNRKAYFLKRNFYPVTTSNNQTETRLIHSPRKPRHPESRRRVV